MDSTLNVGSTSCAVDVLSTAAEGVQLPTASDIDGRASVAWQAGGAWSVAYEAAIAKHGVNAYASTIRTEMGRTVLLLPTRPTLDARLKRRRLTPEAKAQKAVEHASREKARKKKKSESRQGVEEKAPKEAAKAKAETHAQRQLAETQRQLAEAQCQNAAQAKRDGADADAGRDAACLEKGRQRLEQLRCAEAPSEQEALTRALLEDSMTWPALDCLMHELWTYLLERLESSGEECWVTTLLPELLAARAPMRNVQQPDHEARLIDRRLAAGLGEEQLTSQAGVSRRRNLLRGEARAEAEALLRDMQERREAADLRGRMGQPPPSGTPMLNPAALSMADGEADAAAAAIVQQLIRLQCFGEQPFVSAQAIQQAYRAGQGSEVLARYWLQCPAGRAALEATQLGFNQNREVMGMPANTAGRLQRVQLVVFTLVHIGRMRVYGFSADAQPDAIRHWLQQTLPALASQSTPLRVLLRFTEVEFYLQLHGLIGMSSDDPTESPWEELQIFSEDPASDDNWRRFMVYRDAAGDGAFAGHRYGHRGDPTHGLCMNIAAPPLPPLDRTSEGEHATGGQLLCRGAEALSEADRRALRRPKCKVGMTGLYNCVFMAGCGRTLDNHQDLLDKAGSSGRYPSAFDAGSPVLFTIVLDTPSLYLEPAPGVYQRVSSYPPSAATTVPDATWGEASLLCPHMGHAGDTRYMRTSSWSRAPWGNVIHRHVKHGNMAHTVRDTEHLGTRFGEQREGLLLGSVDGGGNSGGDSGGHSGGDSDGHSGGVSDGDSGGVSDGDSGGDSDGDSGGDSDGDSGGDSGGDSDGDCGGGHGGHGISGASAARSLSVAAFFTLPVLVATTESVLPPSPPSPEADHTATHHALLTLFVLPTIAQQNFELLCSLLACFLSCGILGLRYCAAAPMADPVRRSAQWLLARLSPYRLTREHIAACVIVLLHLWSREWWMAAGVAVWFALQGCCASRRAELAPHSCSERALHLFSWTASWSERAEQFGRGLMVVIAYCEDTPTAPTAEQLRVLELQLLSEMAEFVVLDLLLQHLLWARTRLLRWLDETEATPVD